MPVTSRQRVRYAETDQMGIVYYANYLVWFEIGRVELLRSLGLAYSQMEKDHKLILPVVEANCRYRAPARYDDEILVKTWVEKAHPRLVTFAYEIRLALDNSMLASGATRHLILDREFRRTRLPEKYFHMFGLQQ